MSGQHRTDCHHSSSLMGLRMSSYTKQPGIKGGSSQSRGFPSPTKSIHYRWRRATEIMGNRELQKVRFYGLMMKNAGPLKILTRGNLVYGQMFLDTSVDYVSFTVLYCTTSHIYYDDPLLTNCIQYPL